MLVVWTVKLEVLCCSDNTALRVLMNLGAHFDDALNAEVGVTLQAHVALQCLVLVREFVEGIALSEDVFTITYPVSFGHMWYQF